MYDLKPSDTSFFLESVLDSLPLCVYRIAVDGSLIYVNKALQNLLGTDADQILGKTAYDLYPPAVATRYRNDDIKVMTTGKPLHILEHNIRAVGGAKHVEVHKTPLFDENGDVIGVQGVFWDISERFIAEQEQAKNELLLKTISEQSPNHVILLNELLRIVYINKTVEGMSNDDFLGANYLKFESANREQARRCLLRTLTTGEITTYQTTFTPPSGNLHYFEVICVRLSEAPLEAKLHLTATDITQRIYSEQKLRQAAAVFTFAKEAILIADAKGKISLANQAFTDITGHTPASCTGQNIRSYLSSDNPTQLLNEVASTISQTGAWQGELNIIGKRPGELVVSAAISTIRNDDSDVQSYVILLSDITRQKQHQLQLEHIAHYDALTGLPNRYLLSNRLKDEIANATLTGERLAVVYLDLDGFKSVNDHHGHSIGDQLLIKVSQRLLGTLDVHNMFARIGGDEFLIVIPHIDTHKNIDNYYRQILKAISLPIHSDVGIFELSASLGITYFPQEDSVDPDHLIRQADIAMYQAKIHGKNQIAEFDPIEDKHQRGYGKILTELRHGIDNEELRLYYQPKVNMKTGEILGAEALVRWNHRRKGLLEPEAFLGATVEDPIAIRLDHWVLRNALRQLQNWQVKKLHFAISINVSIQTLEHPDFIHIFKQLIEQSGANVQNRVTLEILESSAIADIGKVSQIINECSTLGIDFSLDDFGTGFSTLSFLKHLPASELKIDRSFVSDMLKDTDDMAIIQSILGMASAFSKRVVAEGVETDKHCQELLQLGCQVAQGFAIARPLSATDFESWCIEWQQTMPMASRFSLETSV